MRAPRAGFGRVARYGAVVSVLCAAVVWIVAAQAAPSTKVYDATVNVQPGTAVTATSATLRLTLTNDTKSQQTLGSANFTAQAGISNLQIVDDANVAGWHATVDGSIVKFRSDSSSVALTKGAAVYADVSVTIAQAPMPACVAAWTTDAKQSNDFSGQPGNGFAPNTDRSNLRPLGSFVWDPIGTVVDSSPDPGVQALFVPQILTAPSPATTVTFTAKDICGQVDAGYGTTATGHYGDNSSLAADNSVLPTPRLKNATIVGPTFASTGAGSATVSPVVVETGDRIILADGVTGISATSDPSFDVVQRLCYGGMPDATCTWQNDTKNPVIFANTDKPSGDKSFGLGFNSDLASTFTCGTGVVGSSVVDMNPRNYVDNYHVQLTYKKSVTGSGPASSFVVCLSDTNGQTWFQINPCATVPVAPCIYTRKRITGSDLLIDLFLAPGDPWGGTGFG